MSPFEVVLFSLLGGATTTVLLVGLAHFMGLVPEDDDEV